MGLGAVAAVAAIVAVVSIAPWKGTGAAPASVATPAAAQPAASEPPAPVAAAPSQPEPQPTAATPAPVSQPMAKSQHTPAPTAHAAQAVPAISQPAASSPAPAAAPQSPAQQPAAAQPPPPAVTEPNRAELQQLREHLALLGVRAAGIRTSLESLQRSQAASGMSLRGDMQQAANLMTTYLQGADAALNAGDVVQSRSFADKAERQVEKLEKFFNR